MGKHAIISLSGGMDSVTLLYYMIAKGYRIHPVLFQYGSNHNELERRCAAYHVDELGLMGNCRHVSVGDVFSLMESKLLGGEVPEGHYEAESMKQTVVPGRNSIFATILMGYAESLRSKLGQTITVALGIHAGDHAIYPDCRPAWLEAMRTLSAVCSDYEKDGTPEPAARITAPFLHMTKKDILKVGFNLKLNYKFTRTCYTKNRLACGRCGSCQERLEAFRLLGKEDPVEYEN